LLTGGCQQFTDVEQEIAVGIQQHDLTTDSCHEMSAGQQYVTDGSQDMMCNQQLPSNHCQQLLGNQLPQQEILRGLAVSSNDIVHIRQDVAVRPVIVPSTQQQQQLLLGNQLPGNQHPHCDLSVSSDEVLTGHHADAGMLHLGYIDDLCPVCNDRVSGYHYGLQTCESCKGNRVNMTY